MEYFKMLFWLDNWALRMVLDHPSQYPGYGVGTPSNQQLLPNTVSAMWVHVWTSASFNTINEGLIRLSHFKQ